MPSHAWCVASHANGRYANGRYANGRYTGTRYAGTRYADTRYRTVGMLMAKKVCAPGKADVTESSLVQTPRGLLYMFFYVVTPTQAERTGLVRLDHRPA